MCLQYFNVFLFVVHQLQGTQCLLVSILNMGEDDDSPVRVNPVSIQVLHHIQHLTDLSPLVLHVVAMALIWLAFFFLYLYL